jgi:hypothetical protein
MEEPKARILCVDNEANACEMVRPLLGKSGVLSR